MKKLCFVIPSMRRGGAERVMSILLNAAKAENEVYLILFGPEIEYEIDSRVKVFSLADKLKNNYGVKLAIKRLLYLKQLICEINPDLVVSFLTTCNIYTIAAVKGTGIPVIVSERNDPVKDCPSRVKRLVRNYFYSRANGIVFQTEEAQKHFSASIQDKSTVISNPVKSDLPIADVSESKNKIVSAARLTEQKNYPMMLKAFKMFSKDHKDYSLHIFGEGCKKAELERLSSDLGIDDKVFFEGNVIDLHDRIKSAKMFVLSSDYEGISNSLLEAMSMGLPCVSTDCPCGGSRMLIEDGFSGLLVPVGDYESFSKAMSRISESDSFALKLSQNAIKVRERYSEDVVLNKYFDYFSLILNNSKKDVGDRND